MKILVVDDSVFMQKLLSQMLSKLGHSIVCARSGEEGIHLYLKVKPDIVTLDYNMYPMNGLETLKLLKQIDPKVNVIVISAQGNMFLKKEFEGYGILGFITKPFTIEQLQEKIQSSNKFLAFK